MDTTTIARRERRLDELPSPPGLPLLGNIHQIDIPRLHQVLEDWCGRLGSPYLLRLGPRQVFVSANPETLQAVARERPDRYRRVRQIEACIDELGSNGLFSVEGQAWKPQRKLVMQALASTHFRGFFPALQTITARMHRRWAAAAAAGGTVDMAHDLVRFTVDVTTALAFGEDPNTIESDGDAIQDHLALVFPALMERINAPLPTWRWFKLPKDRRLDRAVAAISVHVDRLIAQARRRMVEDPAPAPRHVLESLLLARDEPGSGVDDADVRANVFTLLLAGEDTTAHTLSWTLYFLAQDAAAQDDLHAAARSVLGDAPVCPAFDDVRRLDAFEAAANEATRLKPIVPLLFFEPNEDVVVEGVALPRGTPMFFVLRPAMVDSQHFAEPERFDISRWAAGHPVQPHDARAYMQFGAGPRVCPGRHLAAVEIRLLLSMLMRWFRIELAADPAAVREVMAFTMMPSQMPVRLVPR